MIYIKSVDEGYPVFDTKSSTEIKVINNYKNNKLRFNMGTLCPGPNASEFMCSRFICHILDYGWPGIRSNDIKGLADVCLNWEDHLNSIGYYDMDIRPEMILLAHYFITDRMSKLFELLQVITDSPCELKFVPKDVFLHRLFVIMYYLKKPEQCYKL